MMRDTAQFGPSELLDGDMVFDDGLDRGDSLQEMPRPLLKGMTAVLTPLSGHNSKP